MKCTTLEMLEMQDARRRDVASRYKFDRIDELRDPIEVWTAVEGDCTKLIELLRSNEKLGPRTRNALADWLEGKLEPVKLPNHRVRRASKVSWAWYRYDKAWTLIREKGWHRKRGERPGWSREKLLEAVAKKDGVAVAALDYFERRAKPNLPLAELIARSVSAKLQRRQEIARKIRSKK